MSLTFSIHLHHHQPEDVWTVTATNGQTAQTLGGLFTSAEAALYACWLTVDERITLPAIATYAQVRELLAVRTADPDVEVVETVVPEEVPA
jgi:hypothetical protein